jgi:hypothetical protein
VRNLIFDAGFEQGYERGHAAGEVLVQPDLNAAYARGEAAGMAMRYSRADGQAFTEGYGKGKGKGVDVGFADGWQALQEHRRLPRPVWEYLKGLVDADEREALALERGNAAWSVNAHSRMGARHMLADFEPEAPDRQDEEERSWMLRSLENLRAKRPRLFLRGPHDVE